MQRKAAPLVVPLLGVALISSLSNLYAVPLHPKFGFPVYTNAPAGRQLTGQHAPASTPALAPDDARRKFTLPEGYDIRLFASEPDVVNPVAMTWDDRGRLWVVELYEYPLGARPGARGRDRIKILEDVDGDGRVDSVKVFADGFSLATGILVANGGVYLGQAPNLYFLEDLDGDDVADRKTVVQSGFGLEDRHELLNGFTWGPDGQMYMTHGVFTRTEASDPAQPHRPPVLVTAGVARFHPERRRLEVYAEGTSNPWGVDFDGAGNAYVSACVIDHLFHLVPGGLYARQAGQPPHPYGYGLLPSIVDHKHHMAAYSGVCIYQGDQFPTEMKGAVLEGNIHDNAIHWDKLTPAGASFRAGFVRDFVRANDGWFMPVSTQVGPDGAVWIMDWYDRYPCYQNAGADPEGVDRERGRIWRVVWTGGDAARPVPSRPAGLRMSALSNQELIASLGHPNVWQRRMAQRILSGRRDPSTRSALESMVRSGSTPDSRRAALWTAFSSGLADDGFLSMAARLDDPVIRAWAVRFAGERRWMAPASQAMVEAASAETDPRVRLAAAVTVRQWVSDALTVDLPPSPQPDPSDARRWIQRLIEGSKDGRDPVINHLIWMAAEPVIAAQPAAMMEWFSARGAETMPLSGEILAKAMRRWSDLRDPRVLDDVLGFLGNLPATSTALLVPALDGLIEGQRGKALVPGDSIRPLMEALRASPVSDVVTRAQQLGAVWGDSEALKRLLASIQDPGVPEATRLKAIQSVRQSRTEDARSALSSVVTTAAPDAVKVEAIRALGEGGYERTAALLTQTWKQLAPAPRRAAAEVLSSRHSWIAVLLNAVEQGRIDRGEIPMTVVRNLATHRSDDVRNKSRSVFGRVNASPAEKLAVVAAKRRVAAEGMVDLEEGHKLAQKLCLTCHRLHGEGAEVGPDLTGVGRSSLDALLHNIILPNEIIGQGYENVEVETRDGRTVSGRLVENTDARVRLLMAGPQEEVIARTEVKAVRVSENSVMPEGLEQLPDADFRNLIWYILAPPQDGKPLTPERRRELLGGPESASTRPSGPPGIAGLAQGQ